MNCVDCDDGVVCMWLQNSNPVLRLRKYLEAKGWWSESQDKELIATEKKAVLLALKLV